MSFATYSHFCVLLAYSINLICQSRYFIFKENDAVNHISGVLKEYAKVTVYRAFVYVYIYRQLVSLGTLLFCFFINSQACCCTTCAWAGNDPCAALSDVILFMLCVHLNKY